MQVRKFWVNAPVSVSLAYVPVAEIDLNIQS
jgi:hypothetical protein